MDLNNMIFPAGSTFVFGAWLCKADNGGMLRGCLLEGAGPPSETFPEGSTFVFRSWVYDADFFGKLQGHLLEDPENQRTSMTAIAMADQLVDEISWLMVFGPTRIPQATYFDYDLGSLIKTLNNPVRLPHSLHNPEGRFLFRLDNIAKTFQDLMKKPAREL
jgi:hypothetical protein